MIILCDVSYVSKGGDICYLSNLLKNTFEGAIITSCSCCNARNLHQARVIAGVNYPMTTVAIVYRNNFVATEIIILHTDGTIGGMEIRNTMMTNLVFTLTGPAVWTTPDKMKLYSIVAMTTV